MYWFKNKFFWLIFSVLIITFVIPLYSFANDKTSFVWSDESNTTTETVASLTQDKRKFSKSYLWWCNSYRAIYWHHSL